MKNIIYKVTVILAMVVLSLFSVVSYADEETNEVKEAKLSIGEITIDNFTENQEIVLPVKITDIEGLCAGTLSIDCSSLEFVGLENENSAFQFASSKNEANSKLVVNFSGTKGINGNVDLVNIKFKMPEKMENNSNIIVVLDSETSLVTTKAMKANYTIENGIIHVNKGNVKATINFVPLIVCGVVIVVAIVAMLAMKDKKVVVICSIVVIVAALAVGGYTLINKNGNSTVKHATSAMIKEDAEQIAKLRYEFLLDASIGKSLDFEKDGDSIKIYNFDEKTYVKIQDFDTSIKGTLSDELVEDFCIATKILEKDGSYYMSAQNIGTIEDLTYDKSVIEIKDFSETEIKAEVVSTYNNYLENTTSQIRQKYELKKVNGTWKVTEFTLPY